MKNTLLYSLPLVSAIKLKNLKKFIPVILLFVSSIASAQWNQWSAPVRLTDTTSFNSNPAVAVIGDYEGPVIMYYEKKFSPDSPKQIWMRKISDPFGPETAIFANDSIEYKNPIILWSNMLLFESNAEGNFNIYGAEFDEAGNFEESFQLTDTPGDEINVYSSSESGCCCWEYDGNIIISQMDYYGDSVHFTEIDTLDSGDCHNPVCIDNYAAWLKIENNESHVYLSKKVYPFTQWSDPETVMNIGDNLNLSISGSLFFEGRTLCWENADSLLFYDLFYPEPIWSPHFDGIEKCQQPSAFDLYLITDNLWGIFSFVGKNANLSDIYIYDPMYTVDPVNVTNDTEINSNPILFAGRFYDYYYEVLNIWQTQVNGFEALYKSDAYYLLGSVAENNSANKLSLQVSPNPFSDEIKFEFNLPGTLPYTLEIFNISGEKIIQMITSSGSSGNQSLTWNPHKEGISLHDGIYFVKLTQGENSTVRKVIYSGR